MNHIKLYLSFLILTGFLFFSCRPTEQQTEAELPNVVFILVDDLGYADLGYAGSKFHDTPHVDELANESWQFTHGYSGSRVCSPARATIMTGQFTARHGITDWIGAKAGEEWREHQRHDPMLPASYDLNLDKNHITIAKAFKDGGYKTFYAGKWHLGEEGSHPEDHGFDLNIGGWDKGSPVGGFFSPYNNPKIEDGPAGENLTMRLAGETAAFIEENKEYPFFAYLSFYAVHAPIQTTQDKWDKYRQKAQQMGVAEKGFEMGEKLPHRTVQDNPVYAGLVESVDDAIGLVLSKLKELNLDQNTIVVFTSDNGGVVAGDNYATNNLLVKGGKGQHWEGGIRVPFLIKVPGIDPSRKLEYPVTGADFYPTLLELAGLQTIPDQHLDGISLVPLFQGRDLDERYLIWHYPHYGNQGGVPSSIIRRGKWKLIHYWEDHHKELYNLEDDPFEEYDLSTKHAEKVVELSEELDRFLQEQKVALPRIDPEYNVELARKRREGILHNLLPQLEKQRVDYLDENWQPNEDWWGSQPVTVD